MAHHLVSFTTFSYPDYECAIRCQGMASCLTMKAIAVLANPSKAAAEKRLCRCGDELIHQKLSCALRLRIFGSRHAFSPGCGEEYHDNLRRATSERACGTPHLPRVDAPWLEISRDGLCPGLLRAGKEPPAH